MIINKKEIRDSLTAEQIIKIMNKLGCSEYEDHDNYIQFKSICHNIDENEAGLNLSYYKDSHRFYCFSNCHSMDIFSLIKHRWDLLNYDSSNIEHIFNWITNNCNINLDNCQPNFISAINPNDYKNKTIEIQLPEKSDKVLDTFIKYYPIEWLNNGISKEAMDEYNIKYYVSNNSIIIPHYDVNNRLIGIRQRVLNECDIKNGKYKPLYIQKTSYSHPLGYNLYGLNIVKEEIKSQKRIIIAEGEKSCLQGFSYWGKNNIVVATCGHNLNRWQVFLIMKYCQPSEIIIAYDKGIELENIYKMCEKYSIYCDFSYIADPFNKLKDKESPFDRLDIIDELIKTRIKVR